MSNFHLDPSIEVPAAALNSSDQVTGPMAAWAEGMATSPLTTRGGRGYQGEEQGRGRRMKGPPVVLHGLN